MTNANQPRRSLDRSGVSRLRAFLRRRSIVSDVVQGIIIGCVLALITLQILAHTYVTKVNGWGRLSCKCPTSPAATTAFSSLIRLTSTSPTSALVPPARKRATTSSPVLAGRDKYRAA
jgi:hypothetical protein